MGRLLASAALLAAVAHAWDECHFPTIDFLTKDEGVGKSSTYSLTAMNGNMYTGGYTKGNFALVGIHKDGVDVNPDPLAAIWGTTHSDVQSLYIAEVNSEGKMTYGWLLKSSSTHVGDGHVLPTNNINDGNGLHRMLDGQHIAVAGYFKENLAMPDGTQYSTEGVAHPRSIPFVMKLDVDTRMGVGPGTTGWSKNMDDGFAGGASVYSVDGDTSGNMILSMQGCNYYNESAVGYGYYGRPVYGAAEQCSYMVKKLSAADGSEVFSTETPINLSPCRVIEDGSFFCGFSVGPGRTYDFGPFSLTSPGVGTENHVGVVKYSAAGVPLWAKETIVKSYGGDISVNKDGTLLAVVGSGPDTIARIDTSAGNEGNVLWEEHFGGAYTGYGSWDVFVAAFEAETGAGKYATDFGGTGMDYQPAFASDPDTGDFYVGGYTRSELLMEGTRFFRENQMYNGQPGQNNAVSSSSVGSNKAYVTKFKSELTLPECLDSCDSSGATTTMTVKDGHCYIDRYCYAHEQASPYAGSECTHCDASTDAMAWSAPAASDEYCVISGACVAKGAMKPGTGYRAPPSTCETCDPAAAEEGYSVMEGYILNDEGNCHKPDWMEVATANNWRELPPRCHADTTAARERRQLSEKKKRQKRKLAATGVKASYKVKASGETTTA